jgi:hypothetical protein
VIGSVENDGDAGASVVIVVVVLPDEIVFCPVGPFVGVAEVVEAFRELVVVAPAWKAEFCTTLVGALVLGPPTLYIGSPYIVSSAIAFSS